VIRKAEGIQIPPALRSTAEQSLWSSCVSCTAARVSHPSRHPQNRTRL